MVTMLAALRPLPDSSNKCQLSYTCQSFHCTAVRMSMSTQSCSSQEAIHDMRPGMPAPVDVQQRGTHALTSYAQLVHQEVLCLEMHTSYLSPCNCPPHAHAHISAQHTQEQQDGLSHNNRCDQ